MYMMLCARMLPATEHGMEREKFAQGNRDFEQIKTLSYHAMAAFNTSTRLFDGLMYFVVILAGPSRQSTYS